MSVTLTNIPKTIGAGQVYPGNPIGLLLALTYSSSDVSTFDTLNKNTAPVYTLSKKTSYTDAYELSISGNTAVIPTGTPMGLLMALTYAEDQAYAVAGDEFTLSISDDFELTIQPADDTSSVTLRSKS